MCYSSAINGLKLGFAYLFISQHFDYSAVSKTLFSTTQNVSNEDSNVLIKLIKYFQKIRHKQNKIYKSTINRFILC